MFDFLFNWSSEFEIHIEELDIHHQQLFRIGRDCEQLIQMKCIGVKDKQLLDIVAALKEYTTYHFYEEEELMRTYSYPNMKAHMEYHSEFSKHVSNIPLPKLKANPVKELNKIRDMIQEAVFFHILDEDKKMAEYVLEQKKKTISSEQKKADPFEDKYGIKICDLDLSTAYLVRDQSNRGRCILIFRNKVNDITALTALERDIFSSDLVRLAKALKKAFSPAALNYAEYGDVEERLHINVVPKYKESDQFGKPFRLEEPAELLSDEEYQSIAAKIKMEIKN